MAVTAVALLGALLIWSAPAHGLAQRGHSFSGSFGESLFAEGRKANTQSAPTAIAVNEASEGEGAGDVYVLDSAGNRVLRFGQAPEHKFIEMWGFGVENGSHSFQRCTSSCELGIPGHSKGQFQEPSSIAVDSAPESPSQGDVYVVANRTVGHAVVDKFSAEGKLLDTLPSSAEEKEETEGVIEGVAVDQTGTVWVEQQHTAKAFYLERFNDAVKNKLVGEAKELLIEGIEGNDPIRPGFAFNAEGEAYVTYEPGGQGEEELQEEREEIAEREKERKKHHEAPANEQPQVPCSVTDCLVAKLSINLGSGAHELEPTTLSSELDEENSTGVATDLAPGAQASNDGYVDNATSVAAFTAGGSLIERFGSAQLQDGGGGSLAVDGASNEVLVADTVLGRIDAYTPSQSGPPVVEAGSVGAARVTSSSAELRATIDASGADTHYRFQYGTTSCAPTPSPCSEAPAPPAPAADLGQGYGDQGASAQVTGLSPSTTYYVRVIAENEHAAGEQAVVSEERTFESTSSTPAPALPDDRAWELVTPADKHGASVEPIVKEGGLVEAASNGKAIAYMTTAPIYENESEVEGNRAPERSQILATRGPGGWASHDIVTPNETAGGVRGGLAREYQFFSPNLEEALVEPVSGQPLSAEATEKTVYLRHNLTCSTTPASCFEPLVTATNDTAGSKFDQEGMFSGATPDLSHVILHSNVPLLSGESHGGLYEWSAGTLSPVSLLPKGEQATGTLTLGGGAGNEMHSTAISQEGSRVVWRAGATGYGHLYMRDTETGETLQIDEPDSGLPTPTVESIPDFKGASANGSRVFFTDNQRLAENSTAPEESTEASPRDLYVFEPEKRVGERVTDLTPDLNSGEAAAVHGGALVSENGSRVYFVANGVLASNLNAKGEQAQAGDCHFRAPSGAGCNLYVASYNGERWEDQWIARLSSEDNPDWGKPESSETGDVGAYNLKAMTSRVSPNGEYLAFMSNQSLTGYNNSDANSGVADEEVYLYKYGPEGSGSVVCASCNPSGAQPNGVYDTQASGEGLGLVVDRPQTWGTEYVGVDHWLAGNVPGWTSVALFGTYYQSNYLSDSGRLFFNSSDSLVPSAVNKKENVYEYEPTGIGSCSSDNTTRGCVALISSGESERESAFLDASENGDDVFFLTNAKLVPQDIDTAADIYDARVCGVAGTESCPSSSQSPAPTQCGGEECKGPSTSAASLEVASGSTVGSGNVAAQSAQSQVLGSKTTQKPKPLTRAQKLAAALKSCRKLKHKSKRLACEKKARASYGAKKASARKSSRATQTQTEER